MQVLKTTIKLRPQENPYTKLAWYSGWVKSRDNRIIATSPSMKHWLNCNLAQVLAWAKQFAPGREPWKSEFVEEK